MNRLLAVYKFELKRILTPGRSMWWFLVVAFPVSITLLMQNFVTPPRGASQQDIDTVFTIALYFLGPSIGCMLGALLTAAPSVASELEQHSWIYLATRPNGLFHLVIGKFLVAVTWTGSAAMIGIVLSLPFSRIAGWWVAGVALLLIAFLSSLGYSALYIMIRTP